MLAANRSLQAGATALLTWHSFSLELLLLLPVPLAAKPASGAWLEPACPARLRAAGAGHEAKGSGPRVAEPQR